MTYTYVTEESLFDTYQRCPSIVNSYNYYCYAMFANASVNYDVSRLCRDYGGLPVWLADSAELLWLQSVLQAYSVDCFHIGKSVGGI